MLRAKVRPRLSSLLGLGGIGIYRQSQESRCHNVPESTRAMSWDIFVQDLPKTAGTVEEIPDDFTPRPIGKRMLMVEKIRQIVPTADFSDPSWGRIHGENWSIEIDMGKDEECSGFCFHVRGSDAAAGVVAAILEELELRALDPAHETGFFTGGPDAVEAFRRWRAYRDQVARLDPKSSPR